MAGRSILSSLASLVGRAVRQGVRAAAEAPTTGSRRDPSHHTAVVEIDPPGAGDVTLSYAPDRDGDPDAGEVVWAWVPYAEHDGRGKDRPVLVIARANAAEVFAVKLTSRSHEGDRGFLPLGPGAWDSRGRPSWVDVDQVYRIGVGGMRREGAALDATRFRAVAEELRLRYGWTIAE